LIRLTRSNICLSSEWQRARLAAIKREERKLEKELNKLQHQLNGVRAAAKALGSKASREVTQVKKRVMSAAARAKISKASKARWAKFRAENSKKGKTLQKAARSKFARRFRFR
jgi:hypothetical protein